MHCSFFLSFGQNGTADCTCEMLSAAACIDIDRIQSDVSAVENTKTGSNHAAFDFNTGNNRLFRDRFEHRWYNAAKRRSGRAVQTKQRLNPLVRDPVAELDSDMSRIKNRRRQI